MAGLAANLQHYLGPRLNDLAIKHNIQFNEIELLKTNRTREHLLSLITNDIRLLDKLFVFKKHQHSPDKDLGEQKEIDDKEFTRKEHEKDKRITSIIKGLISKGLLEEAVSLYMYRERLKVLMLELRRLSALKEEAEYARQVAIYEAERAVLMQASQQALFLELERLQKEQDKLFEQIRGHKKEIGRWDGVIDETDKQIKQLIKQAAVKLGNDLQHIIPEASPEKRQAAASEFLLKRHDLHHERRVLKAQNKQLEKKIAKKETHIQDKQNRIRQLKHEVMPSKSEKLNKDDPLSSVAFTTQFNSNQMESKQRFTEQSSIDKNDPRVQELSDLQREVAQDQQALSKMKTKLLDNKARIKDIDVEDKQLSRVHATKLVEESNIPDSQKAEKIEAIVKQFDKAAKELHEDKKHIAFTDTLEHAVDKKEEHKHLASELLDVAKKNQPLLQAIVTENKFATIENIDLQHDYATTAIDSPQPVDQAILDANAKTIAENDDIMNSFGAEFEDTPQETQKLNI